MGYKDPDDPTSPPLAGPNHGDSRASEAQPRAEHGGLYRGLSRSGAVCARWGSPWVTLGELGAVCVRSRRHPRSISVLVLSYQEPTSLAATTGLQLSDGLSYASLEMADGEKPVLTG